MDRQLLWSLAVTVGYVGLLVPVIRKKKLTNLLLSLYILVSLAWIWSRYFANSDMVTEQWQLVARVGLVYGIVFLSAILGVLTSAFLRQEVNSSWHWPVEGGVIVLAMIVLDWYRLPKPTWLSVYWSEMLSIVGWVGLAGAAYFWTWRTMCHTRRPLHRNRLRYWMLVMVLVLCGDALFISTGFPYAEIGAFLHWCGAAVGCIALLSHHLPDLAGIARQGIRYVLLTLLTGLVFWGTIVGAQYVIQYAPDARTVLIGTGGIALLLAILYPILREWIQGWLSRLFFGRGYDRERILREYSQGISNILDLDLLVTVATGVISEAMEISRGMLLVCESNARFKLRPVRGMGEVNVEPIELDPDSPPISYMSETGVPLSQYDLDLLPRFQDISPEERAWFSSLDVEMYVPIRAQEQLLGILALGAKQSGDPYTSADIALLRTLAGQTAVALKNARLVEDLRRLNAEITQLNEDLKRTNERLTILDRTKSDFISIASHELKTPLTHIRGYTEILMEMSEGDTISPASVRQMTEAIIKGAKRLQEVVDAMLDVSLIEAEAFTIHPIPISLGYVLDKVIGGLEAAFKERRQMITTAGLETLPDVIADGTRLHQAFRNILLNSIKFTPDGGRIDVRARVISDGREVEIAFADTGIGIDPEHQELIFEKFYRVGDLNLHSSGQIKFKGAGPGLGLPIAKGIIEAHGGRIWVESAGYNEETCPGSTFYVVLPVDGPPRHPSEVVAQEEEVGEAIAG